MADLLEDSLINNDHYEDQNCVYFLNSYLDQWHESHFDIDDIHYNCTEQRMMHMKAVTFNDTETADQIMQTNDPEQQKALGRQVKNFSTEKWSQVCDEIVFQANLRKFQTNKELKEKLLATGEKLIVECSPFDKIWGNGLDIKTTLQTPMSEWQGKNKLGKALMRVRTALTVE